MERKEKFPNSIVDIITLFLVPIFTIFPILISIIVTQEIIGSILCPENRNFQLFPNDNIMSLLFCLLSNGFLFLYITRTTNRTWSDILRFSSFHKPILVPLIRFKDKLNYHKINNKSSVIIAKV